jgi:hypothetical protein
MLSPNRVLLAIVSSYIESYPKVLYCLESIEPETGADAGKVVVIESVFDCCRILAPSSQLILIDGLLVSSINSLQVIV